MKISDNLFVMVKDDLGEIFYSPLYIHRFEFLTPRKLLESELINIIYKNPDYIATIGEKLRYYRHSKGLSQIEVAKILSICEATYVEYEKESRIEYPIENLLKLALLYNISIFELLDEYNLFLYNGQEVQLKNLRKEIGITQKEFAQKLNIDRRTFGNWEIGKTKISKNSYIRVIELSKQYLKNKI